MDNIEIRKVVKGKVQNRVTIPRSWSQAYVAIKPVNTPSFNLPNVQETRKKYVKK